MTDHTDIGVVKVIHRISQCEYVFYVYWPNHNTVLVDNQRDCMILDSHVDNRVGKRMLLQDILHLLYTRPKHYNLVTKDYDQVKRDETLM